MLQQTYTIPKKLRYLIYQRRRANIVYSVQQASLRKIVFLGLVLKLPRDLAVTAEHAFILCIMLTVTGVWMVMSRPKLRQRLPKIYLIVRSWWWMLAVLFLAFLWGELALFILFIIIVARAALEVLRLSSEKYKHSLILRLIAAGVKQSPLRKKEQLKEQIDTASKPDSLDTDTSSTSPTSSKGTGFKNSDCKKHSAGVDLKIDGWTVTMLSVLLIFVFSLLTLTRLTHAHEQTGVLLFALFACQFGDIAQYLCGKALGGKLFAERKLAANISPNKTIEGALFGSLLSAFLASLLALWLTPFTWLSAFMIAWGMSVFGICGDLLESAFKRHHGVKDTGTMLAGHGGILDRIDSLLLSVPMFALIYGLWLM